ncbi:MAG: hypothetical protein JW841_01245 [Deltaproteobacteria bacterium]|nr:hypothetical protein [Deltaproteobacteria bacterium]
MSKKAINEAAIERNKAWVTGVTKALSVLDNEDICRYVMKSAGKKCAEQILEKTINYYGTPPSFDEMIEAINKRRKEVLKADTFWELRGNKAFFTLFLLLQLKNHYSYLV